MSALPPKVAAAVVAVMADVPRLDKSATNSHGNYNFASIDDFLEAVRPLCAKHGLIIAQNEEGVEMIDGRDKYDKPKKWLLARFSFTLAHSSGETWDERQTRTVMVDASMGSQAFGSAQSYTLKAYMRALFQIATGEKGNDADEHPHADLPAVSPKSATSPKDKATKDQDWTGPLNKSALTTAMRAFGRDLEACSDLSTFDALMTTAVEIGGVKHPMSAILAQCEADLPSWWLGDGADVKGAKKRIDEMREYLTSQEAARMLAA